MDDFERGVLMAASVLIATHNEPTMAADIINQMGLSKADCSSLSEYDRQNLTAAQGCIGGRIKLRGLSAG